MAYNKTTWANNDIITAAGLNNMENGIYANDTAITTLQSTVSGLISSEKKVITGTLNSSTGYVTIDDYTIEEVYNLQKTLSVEMVVGYDSEAGYYHFVLTNASKSEVLGGYSYSVTFESVIKDTNNVLLMLHYTDSASAELISANIVTGDAGDSVVIECTPNNDDVTIPNVTLAGLYLLCKTKHVILVAEVGPDTEHDDEYTVIIMPITSARKWTDNGTHYAFIASNCTPVIDAGAGVLSCMILNFNDSLTASISTGGVSITVNP